MKKNLVWTLLILAFFPIAWLGGVPYPSITGKTVFLRGLVTVALCMMAWLSYMDVSYRAELVESLRHFWKTRIAKLLAVSYGVLAVSTMGAFDRFIAFYGNAERSEGFIGLTFFYLLVVLLVVVFKKRDWDRFFVFSAVTGWIVFLIEIAQALSGTVRPPSVVDNPIYLAAYLLFVGFTGAYLWLVGVREKKVLYVQWGIATVVMSLIGILVAQSRGTIAGLVVGCAIALVYLTIVGRTASIGKRNVRNVALGILAGGIILAGLFVSTINAPVWKHVPGVNRIAAFSFTDGSTRARFVNAQISVDSVNPKTEGVYRTLFGWGWDNYMYAWQSHYPPELYAYDTARFDRPHNKLFDALTMTGVVGLLVYIALVVVFAQLIRSKGRKNMWEGAVLVVWFTAYLVQNLTAFDTLITFFTFFVMLAYCMGVVLPETEVVPAKKQKTATTATETSTVSMVIMTAALVSLWIFCAGTVMPYLQMYTYRYSISHTRSIEDASLLKAFPFAYDTYVRGLLCGDLISTIYKSYNEGAIKKPNAFVDRSIQEMESYLESHPFLYDDHLMLAKMYDIQGLIHNDMFYFEQAEGRYQKALALIPGRQTVIYPYTINLAQQGRVDEAISILEEVYRKNPTIHATQYIIAEVYVMGGKKYDVEALDAFEQTARLGINTSPKLTVKAYQTLMKDFYDSGDRERFIVTLERLILITDAEKASYAAILADTKESGQIPVVDFTGF